VTLVVSWVSRGDWIRNSLSDLTIRYDFIREGGRWVIDDMSSTADGKPWTLRGMLKSGWWPIAHPFAVVPLCTDATNAV
jgi:hypothetical protein